MGFSVSRSIDADAYLWAGKMPSKELNFVWSQTKGPEKEYLRKDSLGSNAKSADEVG